jgi:hypothetical protein
LGATALLSQRSTDATESVRPTAPAVGASARFAGPQAFAGGLPPPAPGTKVPINDTDPFTGKPIEPTSPTTNHKGYVVAFCCEKSAGYKGGWERLTESQKDALVRRFLEN